MLCLRERMREWENVCAYVLFTNHSWNFTIFLRLFAFFLFWRSHNLCTKTGKNLYTTSTILFMCEYYDMSIPWSQMLVKDSMALLFLFINRTIKNIPFLLTFKHLCLDCNIYFFVVLFCFVLTLNTKFGIKFSTSFWMLSNSYSVVSHY